MNNQKQISQIQVAVLQDIECFISQKINQILIHSLLLIKKAARKNRPSSFASVDKKSQFSATQRHNSSKKSQFQSKSLAKSKSKQSNASYDIINGAQAFNEIRRKGIKQKVYTEAFENANECLSDRQAQGCRFSNPFPVKERNNQKGYVVPKLVGLLSSEQISDIEQPFGQNSHIRAMRSKKNYEHSIIQVEDDDDEFQDIILNRLDKIERKVNEMLRQKKKNHTKYLRPQINPVHPGLQTFKLQNVGSGANILYENDIRHRQLYKNQKHAYNKSAAVMSPRVYTFQNSKNSSFYPSAKKLQDNATFKHHFTQRISNPNYAKQKNNQHYFTDNQNEKQMKLNENGKQQNFLINQVPTIQSEFKNNKNKTLGHYRQSDDTLQEYQTVQIIPNLQRKIQNSQNNSINYSKIKRQPVDKDHAFKYIPLSKLNMKSQNEDKNDLQKTQRQMSRHNQQVNFLLSKERGIKYEEPLQDRMYIQMEERGGYKGRIYDERESKKFKSGKNSGVRNYEYQQSDVKAYTEQGDFADSEDELSISSEKNLYSQIQKLKQMTRQQGIKRKQMGNRKQQKADLERLNLEYRYLQKTQRPKYSVHRNQANQVFQEQQILIQGSYPEERVIRVTRQDNPLGQHYVSHNRLQRVNYGIQSQHPSVAYQQDHHQQHALFVQPNPSYYHQQPYNQKTKLSHQQLVQLQNPHYNNEIIQMSQSRSNRKLSSGSLSSFKSIPYHKIGVNPSAKQYTNKQRSVQYIVSKPTYFKIQNKSQY